MEKKQTIMRARGWFKVGRLTVHLTGYVPMSDGIIWTYTEDDVSRCEKLINSAITKTNFIDGHFGVGKCYFKGISLEWTATFDGEMTAEMMSEDMAQRHMERVYLTAGIFDVNDKDGNVHQVGLYMEREMTDAEQKRYREKIKQD